MTFIGTCDCCDATRTTLRRVRVAGIETSACMVCLDESDPDELFGEIERLTRSAECAADWAHIARLNEALIAHSQFGMGA